MITTKKLWCCYRILANGEKNHYYWTLSANRKTSIQKYLAEIYGLTWAQCRKRFGMSIELVNNQITSYKAPPTTSILESWWMVMDCNLYDPTQRYCPHTEALSKEGAIANYLRILNLNEKIATWEFCQKNLGAIVVPVKITIEQSP